jgi:hypothetical protein
MNHKLQHSMSQPRRVPVPIPDGFGEIARRERRSIAGQAVVVLEQFVEHWRSALPSQDRNNATQYPETRVTNL